MVIHLHKKTAFLVMLLMSFCLTASQEDQAIALRCTLAKEKRWDELQESYVGSLKPKIREIFDAIEGENNLVSLACIMNEPEVIQHLYEQGYPLNEKDKTGTTPLVWSILYKKDEAFNRLFGLLKALFDEDEYTALAYNVLSFSIQPNNPALSNPYAAFRALEAITPDSWSALAWAASEDMVPVLATVLRDSGIRDRPWGTDPKGNSPLMIAVKQDNKEVAEVLVSAGTDPLWVGMNDESPLSEALGRNNKDLVLLFATAITKRDVNRVAGATALHWAVGEGRVSVVQVLLQQGMDPDERDKNGNTALHTACYANKPEVIPVLIAYGATLAIANNRGLTSLDICSKLGHASCLREVAEASTIQKAVDHPYGWTPFIVVARRGNYETLTAMMRAGVSIDQVDNDDNTALYWASRYGHLSCVNALLQAGANVHHRNAYGWDPLYWAVKNHHAPVVRALIDAGASPQHLEEHWFFLAYARATLGLKQLFQW